MSAIFSVQNASVSRDSREILSGVDWTVSAGESWVVLGPNGAGKTTLLELISDWETPDSGTVTVLGDVTTTESADWIRPRVGIASAGMIKHISPTETVFDAVISAAFASTSKAADSYEPVDIKRATSVLRDWHLLENADRQVGTLSEGELKRLQLARAIMTDPELLLLDEPTAGLDLGSREELLLILANVTANKNAPTVVMVTHHVEEIPRGFTHALIISGGKVQAAGKIVEVLTDDTLSKAYGLPVEVTTHDGRYSARAIFNV